MLLDRQVVRVNCRPEGSRPADHDRPAFTSGTAPGLPAHAAERRMMPSRSERSHGLIMSPSPGAYRSRSSPPTEESVVRAAVVTSTLSLSPSQMISADDASFVISPRYHVQARPAIRIAATIEPSAQTMPFISGIGAAGHANAVAVPDRENHDGSASYLGGGPLFLEGLMSHHHRYQRGG